MLKSLFVAVGVFSLWPALLVGPVITVALGSTILIWIFGV